MIVFSFSLIQEAPELLSLLDEGWKHLIFDNLAPQTKRKYAGIQNIYLGFCRSTGLAPLPACELTLLRYLAYLKLGRALAPQTIKGHLAAVRHLHLINGFQVSELSLPRLSMARAAATKPVGVRAPRTPVPLVALQVLCLKAGRSPSYTDTLFIAACLLGFFGFLRVSEFAAPTLADKKPGLRPCNVNITREHLSLFLIDTKTDKEGAGVPVYIARQSSPPCPVKWLAEYVRRRPLLSDSLPLFVFEDGTPMRACWFRLRLKSALADIGYRANFNTHSLRIGAATHAASLGLSDSEIMRLGRWKSACFRSYVRATPAQATSLNSKLSSRPLRRKSDG